MRSFREQWLGPVVAVGAAALIGVMAPLLVTTPSQTIDLASGLALGAAACVLLVASHSYRAGRDPARLVITAGAAALTIGWTITILIRAYSFDHPPDAPTRWSAIQTHAWLIGIAVFAGCLLFAAPWRDRRGRSPLRVGTVTLTVASMSGILLLGAWVWAPTASIERPPLIVVGLIAAIAAVRSVARGGWLQWIGSGAFSVAIAMWGVMPLLDGSEASGLSYAELAWYLFLPGVGTIFVLTGVLAAQRADTSRMRRTTDRATEVMEGRAEIASIVAHDVRGPAGTIHSVAGSLRTSYDRLGDPERLEFVGMIQQESRRLLRVADQMSLGLKADAGTLTFSLRSTGLEGPILQAVRDADLGTRPIDLEVDPTVRALIDDRWISEAVRQGLGNADAYSPPEEPIAISLRREGDAALIEVSDRGPGIPPEMREQVFEKFSRWRPAGYEDQPGSGLGLFIVRSIAREHGGDASIEPRPGGGTILQIRIPAEGS